MTSLHHLVHVLQLAPWWLPVGLFFAAVLTIHALTAGIGNLRYNRRMRKRWQAQPIRFSDHTHCPKCGHPLFPPYRLKNEGLLLAWPLRRYTEMTRMCLCGWKQRYLVKWDGLDTAGGIE